MIYDLRDPVPKFSVNDLYVCVLNFNFFHFNYWRNCEYFKSQFYIHIKLNLRPRFSIMLKIFSHTGLVSRCSRSHKFFETFLFYLKKTKLLHVWFSEVDHRQEKGGSWIYRILGSLPVIRRISFWLIPFELFFFSLGA